ncbi:MAG TPA: SDR family oxidoreductase [Candidatus Binatia bacterium]|jgi:meso-butanediol dehydrogenase/(S,S)-butanediol dehydrogenase/diacetyl reductase
MDNNPVILVTGGDSGIGLAICRRFARSGYNVVMSAKNAGKGKKVAEAISRDGAVYVKADVRKEKAVRELIRRTIAAWGRLDVLCNNAGVQKLAPLESASSKLWDEVMSVNARGPFLCSKYALPYLQKARGCIINVASIGGLAGYAGGAAYCASKASTIMMTKVLALETASRQVRVNCICPGATKTSMIPPQKLKSLPKQIPLGRVGEPEDVAEMAFFLASPSARQITGGVFVVDGGITAGRARLA